MSRKSKASAPAFDPVTFGAEMAQIVKGYVSRQVRPLERRIAALEAELARKGKR